jgi:hypothetical protein
VPARKQHYLYIAFMRFESALQPLQLPFTQIGIPVPEAVWKAWPEGKYRLRGTINGIPFDLAPRPVAGGAKFLTVGSALRRQLKLELGAAVLVEYELSDPDLLEVPQELQAALNLDEDALRFWQQYTTGLRRSLVHYVNSAKSTETKVKRALELTAHMKAGRYPLPQKR